MKYLYPFVILSASLLSCNPMKKISREVTPAPMSKMVYFGMPLEEFLAKHGDDAERQPGETSFRAVYMQELSDQEIESVVYYFDEDGNKPMYEMILNYKSESARDRAAVKLFGLPNTESDEWEFTEYDPVIQAWKFKKKLVIIALIPGTEWNK